MAHLIPAALPNDAPPGEIAFHAAMRNAPETWSVIHGLDLSPVNHGKRTEIDFVIIIPEMGVLCVEVKSHKRVVLSTDGGWSTGRDPFAQARDGRYSLQRRLADIAPTLSHIPLFHLAVFPFADFKLKANISVQPWELMDAIEFSAFARERELHEALTVKCREHLAADGRAQPLKQPLSALMVENIVSYCVPVQRSPVNARQAIEIRERELNEFLREPQRLVMKLATNNERVLITGGAGTGKTLIAQEVAKWHAREGRRVGFLCFNHLIGRHLADNMKLALRNEAAGNVVCGSVHSVLGSMADIGHPKSESPSYWDEEFPDLLLEFLTDPIASSECQFDVLVLDEAQDLMARPALFEALEAFLRGGWQDGRFAMFGDFENQVLTDLAAMDAKRMALKRSARPAELSLDENCRNYAKVGDAACSLAALEQDPYSGYMRGPGTLASYDIEYHSTAEEEMQQLRKWILEVRQKGYRDEDVVFLSFRADEQSAAQRLRREGFQMVRVGSVDRGFHFASVQAFKGLEAKVVVLTDVHLDWPALSRNLIYVGLTRALELVRVSCNREHASALLRLEKE